MEKAEQMRLKKIAGLRSRIGDGRRVQLDLGALGRRVMDDFTGYR